MELHSWEKIDRDMTPEQDARARVRLQRPDIKVKGDGSSKCQRRPTAINAAREEYLDAFAKKYGIFDVARGYASDDDEEDPPAQETAVDVSAEGAPSVAADADADLLSTVRALRLALPTAGIKPLLAELQQSHPDVRSKELRELLKRLDG